MTQDIKSYLYAEAERITNGTRRASYGKPENNFARICTMWEAYFRIKGWALIDTTQTYLDGMREFVETYEVDLQPLDVAAMMRLMKEARLAETPDHLDSYQDIIGYAGCGAEVAGAEIPPQTFGLGVIQQYESTITELEGKLDAMTDRLVELTVALDGQRLQQSVVDPQEVL